MRVALRVLGGLALAGFGILCALFAGLEALYVWWLPPERPVRAARPLPPFVRKALWVEFGGRGRPEVDPQVPFLLPIFLRAPVEGPPAQHRLTWFAARPALRPMRTTQFLMRSTALAAWVSRHWTIEEVLDSIGAHAWMGDAGEGFEAAADRFWGRPLHALEPHEVATLIGVMANPRRLDPACHPDSALSARTDVLEKLEAAGLIDAEGFARAVEAPLEVRPVCTKPAAKP